MAKPAGRRYERTIATAERDAEAARMRARGMEYPQIAAALGMKSKSTAHLAVQRALDAAVIPAGREALNLEVLKLDALEAEAWKVLNAQHIHVSDGRVVKDDGVVITDHKPVLMAIDRLLRISERRARLLGLDAPTKQTITVVTEDAVDAELRRLAELHEQLSADADSPA